MTKEEKIKLICNNKNYFGFMHTLKSDDNRLDYFIEQHEKDGFDNTEIWNLYITISKFILPRLKRFKEYNCSFPPSLEPEQWENILNKMINSFELICKDDSNTKEEFIIIDEGLDLFKKYFFDLWD